MDTTVTTGTEENVWGGGNQPLGASYGKLMMWFFLVSDALTFSGFLAAYGFSRFKFIETWPIADEVFTHVPFFHGNYPMYYVAFMTFILIMSSVTMVLAVDAGHKLQKTKVIWYMFLTIIGGAIFVGSQAWEWATFIKGDFGALETKGGRVLQFVSADSGDRLALRDFAETLAEDRVDHEKKNGIWYYKGDALPSYSLNEVVEGVKSNPNVLIRTELLNEDGHKTVLTRDETLKKLNDAALVVEGANLVRNEYGSRLFADFFFFITGFHGFHVFSGVVINCIIFFNVILGTYERRGHYEMVEKVGLYWHFVDLVWVFVFTFFYLV
ncbi:cytochrome c oxidase subunit 3 [Arenibacter algicola]|jgi:cytochrome c oxidase subunit 3|uniref:Cytochrome c oxidase subunit 3 n=1 Tax=Arenibacter algicola TaxID=616991 RepID=A0A221UWN9_9FLAO|nr:MULTISPECIES: cytochrome c oxidase subunit 3 [Arenibacter]ASO05742.1 cytochrome c oxidase subunit 3 [Arenibacter algicola]MDX1758106.1 cytochrome c oxidase subunit 3 [Arenibacter algicola]GBF20862.1 cytochrome c oxidase subunit 3 [Arenibacter sp. NBRC 103722]HCO86320.1 cytochrome oxidase subunit III [Arenibacter sp.]|tara:strand:- start:26753 stop:27727 length:975 start_codon:yes stop_codon:yes gene_type:complete|eukprot:TRINITY_DN5313_c0_g1_i1.p1 TRINITY_DN5313_c0_g1~~TRINITY_DN5313_c0_g1_i1.p1  ORF type:complete len:325 (+),score=57.60 TRINITY_DN5313_c0_g1_i1:170-1144(+)